MVNFIHVLLLLNWMNRYNFTKYLHIPKVFGVQSFGMIVIEERDQLFFALCKTKQSKKRLVTPCKEERHQSLLYKKKGLLLYAICWG